MIFDGEIGRGLFDIILYMDEHPRSKHQEISDACGLSYQVTANRLGEVMRAGLASKERLKRNGYMYSLTANGAKAADAIRQLRGTVTS